MTRILDVAAHDGEATPAFTVTLDNFEGPFDLLLQLITRRRLDITEVALSAVTDEFLAHVRTLGPAHDLEQTTSFLVVAATLLDLKTARLLPQGEVDDLEDLALLEARDLLFARLLQYRAFKMIAGWLGERVADEGRRLPRPGGLEDAFTRLLPEPQIPLSPDAFAALAAAALAPKEPPTVPLHHLHLPRVSVREQAQIIVARVKRERAVTFTDLCADADKLTTVARFLALLQLYREKAIDFTQERALAPLTVRWTGDDDATYADAHEEDEA